MYAQVKKTEKNKRRTVENAVAQKKSNVKQGFGFVDNRPMSKEENFIKNGSVESGNQSIQRVIAPNWRNITQVDAKTESQIGVFFVTGADGIELVVKLEPDAGAEAFAADFISSMGGKAPEVLLSPKDSELTLQLLVGLAKISSINNSARLLLNNIQRFEGKNLLVMEKLSGSTMHESENPNLETFKNPAFIKSLGNLAAFDVMLANYDRLTMGFNLGNIMHDEETGTVTGIDQIARENEIIIAFGRGIVDDVLTSVIGNEISNISARIAKTILSMYQIIINPSDFDTGFSAGLLTIESNLNNFLTLMETPTAKEAGVVVGSTAGRMMAYMEALNKCKTKLKELTIVREKDVDNRHKQLLVKRKAPFNESKSSSGFSLRKLKFWK